MLRSVTRACGIKMKKCSRAVTFIPTDDNAVKMSHPMSQLENLTPDIFISRPETPEFEGMCMADFVSTCRLVYGQQIHGKNVLPLLNEMGYVQRRDNEKPAVIRFARRSQEKYPEQFYGTLLKLYLPYRSEQKLKSSSLPTYESFYLSGVAQLPGSSNPEFVRYIIKRNREKYEKTVRK